MLPAEKRKEKHTRESIVLHQEVSDYSWATDYRHEQKRQYAKTRARSKDPFDWGFLIYICLPVGTLLALDVLGLRYGGVLDDAHSLVLLIGFHMTICTYVTTHYKNGADKIAKHRYEQRAKEFGECWCPLNSQIILCKELVTSEC